MRYPNIARLCGVILLAALLRPVLAETAAVAQGVASAVSSNTIVLDAPCREAVSIESKPLDWFTSQKRGMAFVVR